MSPSRLTYLGISTLVWFGLLGCAAEKECPDFCGEGSTCVDGTCQATTTCPQGCDAGSTCQAGQCVADTVLTCGEGTVESGGKCVPTPCEPACGAGTVCELGTCVPVAASSCTPACAPCEACDVNAATPVCVDTCGAGATCDTTAKLCVADVDAFCGTGTVNVDGKCVPKACEPACEAGNVCELGVCIPVAASSCTPACAPCQACDVDSDLPICVDTCGVGAKCDVTAKLCVADLDSLCGEGTVSVDGKCMPKACEPACEVGSACEMGMCVPVMMLSCQPACAPCQVCDTSGDAAICKDTCGPAAKCDTGTNLCVADIDSLCGAGTVKVDGKCTPIACDPVCGPGTACEMGVCVPVEAVTCSPACGPCEACNSSAPVPACVNLCGKNAACDTATKQCVSLADLHRNAPELKGPFKNGYEVSAKCVTCHASQAADFMGTIHWKWAGATPQLFEADGVTPKNPGTLGKSTLINNFCVATPSNDKRCDQCHAGFGGDPDPAKPQKSARGYSVFDPANTAADSSIPLTHRVDCLVCHSDPTAGYAKDPKNFGNPLGTLNLANSAREIVMPTRTNCGACHFYAGGGDNVKLMGSSLKNPSVAIDVHMGNGMACSTCHADGKHSIKGAGIHVPTNVARTDCSDCHGDSPHSKLASNGEVFDSHTKKIACQTCHIPTFSRGQFGKMDWDWSTAGDNTKGTAGVVTTKVNDLGQPDPAGTAVTTYDYIKGNFKWMRNITPAYAWYNGTMMHVTTSDKGNFVGKGLSDADRITLGAPVGSATDPTSKIHPFKLMKGRQGVYVDGNNSFTIVPNVFGTASLWGVIQAPGYLFSSQATMDTLWGAIFTKGATVAGQIQAPAVLERFDSVTGKGWDWRYTDLYMDLNHEVAPKTKALGAAGACTDCHSATPKIPLCSLYDGTIAPWGVVCP
jgi:hypothetical protein